jgi:N-succinyl-L-ornithine transcarbamylase
MKKFVSAGDAPNIDALVQKALQYKANPLKDHKLGSGKRLGLLFLNPSMRTRLSTQICSMLARTAGRWSLKTRRS